jgi:hypothetical protein
LNSSAEDGPIDNHAELVETFLHHSPSLTTAAFDRIRSSEKLDEQGANNVFCGRLQEAETSFTLAIEVLERFLIAYAKTTTSTSMSAYNAVSPEPASDSDNGDANCDNHEKDENSFIGLENIRIPEGMPYQRLHRRAYRRAHRFLFITWTMHTCSPYSTRTREPPAISDPHFSHKPELE